MASYSTLPGDSFATVATQFYGDPGLAADIAAANPGVLEPLQPGTALVVPFRPGPTPVPVPKDPDAGVKVNLNGVPFKFWKQVTITRSLDAFDKFELMAPIMPENVSFRKAIKPNSWSPVQIFNDGVLMFTGRHVTTVPQSSAKNKQVQIGGLSSPGIMQDCTLPITAYPAEFQKSDLTTIATKLCKPFGIVVEPDATVPPKPFKRVRLETGDAALDFIIDLAKKRKTLVRSSVLGALVLAGPPTPGIPVAQLTEDTPPLEEVIPSFDPESYFSHVTVVRKTGRRTPGSHYTVSTPTAVQDGIMRPLTLDDDDLEPGDLVASAEAAAGRVLAGSAVYSCRVSDWKDAFGNLWEPGATVRLHAPDAMCYFPSDFIINSVRFSRSGKTESAVLELVLAGSYTGVPPVRLPWEG